MGGPHFIGIHHLSRGDKRVQVLLTRNEGGSVSGQCLLDAADRPIIDGPTVASVLATIQDVLDALFQARNRTPELQGEPWGARNE